MTHPRSKISLYLISVLMGFCGLAIPGLSASTIAIIFLVYYDMIYAISHILSQPKKSITFLLILVGGYATGALVGAVAVNTIYINFPVPMVAAVLGFLVGTIPRMTVETRQDFKKPANWVVMIVVAIVFLLYTFLISSKQELVFVENQISFPKDYIIMAAVGMVTSTTLVIPGVDFAVTLMALGYYYALIDLMGNIGSMILFPSRLFLFLAYVIGYGIGSFFLSKGLRYLLKHFPRQLHCVNYALVCVAPLIVIKKCIIDNSNFMAHFTGPQMVWAIVLFAVGFFAYTWVPVVLRYVGLLPKNVQEEANKRAEAARSDQPSPVNSRAVTADDTPAEAAPSTEEAVQDTATEAETNTSAKNQ